MTPNRSYLTIQAVEAHFGLPSGIASLCTDTRISGSTVPCRDCGIQHTIRELNEGGYCEICIDQEFAD